MTYEVRRLQGAITLDADWEKPAWQHCGVLELTNYMGERPEHFPKTQARVAYDDDAVYVIFRVHDRYVKAVASQHQGPVYKDSCVEFFFSPSGQVADGYINLEMNCGGTMLVHVQKFPVRGKGQLQDADLQRITVAHTLPRIVEPEITEPTVWSVEYRIPLGLIQKYVPGTKRPAPGVIWRANFYKCGDGTSHPHWLTWAPVKNEKPNFHLPEYFATLRFE